MKAWNDIYYESGGIPLDAATPIHASRCMAVPDVRAISGATEHVCKAGFGYHVIAGADSRHIVLRLYEQSRV